MLLATTAGTALWIGAVLLIPLLVLGIADARNPRSPELPTTVGRPDAASRSEDEQQARDEAVLRPESGGEQGAPMGASMPH
jgi:hypothetical protein